MSKTKLGMEPLPGLEPDTFLAPAGHVEDLAEERFPGISDIYDDLLLRRIDGEFPISAAIAIPNEATGIYERIAITNNRTNGDRDSTHHAELLAIQNALQQLNDKHLPKGAVLLSTVEPCAMCASAYGHCNGENLIFGASQDELSDRTAHISGTEKQFRTEPLGYSAADYLPGDATVVSGYRLQETLESLGQI